jgi:hypothetical protein
MMRAGGQGPRIGVVFDRQRGLIVADQADRPALPLPSAQLLLYRFGREAEFEGRLVGALERIESGGALRILEALFVRSNAETGELDAVAVRGDGTGRIVAPLLDFRLDAAKRRRTTERAFEGDRAAALRTLAAGLEQGEAMAVLLVDHVWARALEDAVARTGGTPVTSEFVDVTGLAELSAEGV